MVIVHWFIFTLFIFSAPFVWADDESNGDPLNEPLPKLELGVAAGAFYMPDYPGSDESRFHFLPLPFVIYRGDFIKADRDGNLRGQFWNSDKVDFDISFGGGLRTSSDNDARNGMPEQDWMGEFGPRVMVHLHRGALTRLDLSLPLRFVFTTDGWEYHQRGYVFNPGLRFRHRAIFDDQSIFSAGIYGMFGTETLQDYFYEVSPKYATATRPAYDADAGYMGFMTTLFFIHRFSKKFVLFTGVARNFYADAKNRGSPLLQDIETDSFFMGFAWGLYASDETVILGVPK